MKLENRIIGAFEGSLLAIALGQLGPQALLPEEILTVPTMATIGFIVGNKKIESLIKL